MVAKVVALTILIAMVIRRPWRYGIGRSLAFASSNLTWWLIWSILGTLTGMTLVMRMWGLGFTCLIAALIVILIGTKLLVRLGSLDAQARLADGLEEQGNELPTDPETARQGSPQDASRLEHRVISHALVRTGLVIFALTLVSAALLHLRLRWYYWLLFIVADWLASFYFTCLISFTVTCLILHTRLRDKAVLGIRF